MACLSYFFNKKRIKRDKTLDKSLKVCYSGSRKNGEELKKNSFPDSSKSDYLSSKLAHSSKAQKNISAGFSKKDLTTVIAL